MPRAATTPGKLLRSPNARHAGRLVLAVSLLSLFIGVGAAAVVVHAPTITAGSAAGSGGCPGSNALKNFVADTNVTASFTMNGASGNEIDYFLSSVNENPTNGVPGVISYCVYPFNGSLPSTEHALATGADGSSFTVSVGSHQGYFAFQRATGNPSNLPLDGSQNVAMGNATWNSSAPTVQTILLHINDPGVCNMLYGGNPGTCFVMPSTGGSTHCSSPGVAPDALHISLPTPSSSLSNGTTLTGEYEVQVVNYSSSDNGAIVYVPTVDFRYPLNGSGLLSQVAAPHQITISAGGWSAPIGRTMTASGTVAFGSAWAWATTANLAVMTAGGPSGMTVEFRWGWIVNSSGNVTSSWSIPTSTATKPDYSSVFQPAPLVQITSSSNLTATTGTFFGVTLSGAVASTSFKTLVENTNGVEMHCQTQTDSSATASSFSVGVPLTYAANGSSLAPGHYLVHIHDSLGAIVLQLQVTVKP